MNIRTQCITFHVAFPNKKLIKLQSRITILFFNLKERNGLCEGSYSLDSQVIFYLAELWKKFVRFNFFTIHRV